jgi:hypothetical protein
MKLHQIHSLPKRAATDMVETLRAMPVLLFKNTHTFSRLEEQKSARRAEHEAGFRGKRHADAVLEGDERSPSPLLNGPTLSQAGRL